MASFTDQISKFNPYVAQLPSEAMVKVGMYKQQQYDAGVQKIQSYMDNIAGLDVTDKHKAYLQSKLDELGGKLKTVAAGDFSNQQLVNSVGGMATSIIKDPTVQTAIYSAQKIKKGDTDREAAAKAGKTSPNNDRDWIDQKTAWLNDDNINSPFNGQYNEFYDVDKSLMERADKILSRPDEYIVDNPWQRDADGRTKYFYNEVVKDAKGKTVINPKTKQPVTREVYSLDPSKGKEKVDDALLKLSIKGTSASKLFNNFLDSIDSRAAQQLRIDAKAKYRGITAEAFTKDIVDVFNNKKQFQSQEIVNTAVALKNPDLTDLQKATLKAKLNQLQTNEKDGVIDKELNATLQALQKPENLEKYKTDIYTQKHLMNMATDMSTRSYKQELNDNPYFKSYMDKQKFLFDQNKFADESARGWASIQTTRDRLTWEKEKDARDNPLPPGDVVLPGTLPTGGSAPTVASETVVLTEKANAITALENKFASRLFSGMTDDQKRAGFNKLLKDYATNPKANYSPDQLDFLKQHEVAENAFVAQANLVTAAQRKVKEYVNTEVKDKIKGAAGYTGEAIGEMSKQLQQFNRIGPRGITRFDTEAASKYFKTYAGGKYLQLYNDYYNGNFSFNATPKQKEIKKVLDNATSTINTINNESRKIESDYLAEHNPRSLIQRSALNMSDKNEKAAIDKFLTGKLSEELNTGGKSASTVLGWMNGENGGNTRFEIQKSRDGSTQMLAISPDGSQSQVVAMKTLEQDFFPKVKKTSILNRYIDNIANSENHTTNKANQRDSEVDATNAVNAGITGYDVPLLANDPLAPLVRFDIEGNPDNNGTESDGYSLIMYVHPPGGTGWKGKRMHTGYVQSGGIVNMMNGISNVGVQQAMKTWK
jgi:hypothetical protein